MKVTLILLATVALAQADFTWNWSELISLEPEVSPNGQITFPYKKLGSRIVGGDEATPNSRPFQVGLFINIGGRLGLCGGSIISENCILTAANCLHGAVEAEVIAGAHKIREKESTQQRIFTTNFIVHEFYNSSVRRNDIALAILPKPLTLNEFVQPIRLPKRSNAGENLFGALTNISGWGLPSDHSNSISPVLRYVQVNVTTNLMCNSFYHIVTDGNLCTKGSGGKGACTGDSGGPLAIVESDNIYTHRGIISFRASIGCGASYPTGYTRTDYFLDWIETNSGVKISL